MLPLNKSWFFSWRFYVSSNEYINYLPLKRRRREEEKDLGVIITNNCKPTQQRSKGHEQSRTDSHIFQVYRPRQLLSPVQSVYSSTSRILCPSLGSIHERRHQVVGESPKKSDQASQKHQKQAIRRDTSYVGPRIWNTLPMNLRTAGSFQEFKSGLKTYLFKLDI